MSYFPLSFSGHHQAGCLSIGLSLTLLRRLLEQEVGRRQSLQPQPLTPKAHLHQGQPNQLKPNYSLSGKQILLYTSPFQWVNYNLKSIQTRLIYRKSVVTNWSDVSTSNGCFMINEWIQFFILLFIYSLFNKEWSVS